MFLLISMLKLLASYIFVGKFYKWHIKYNFRKFNRVLMRVSYCFCFFTIFHVLNATVTKKNH